MQIDKQINGHASRLILFFNGWSAAPGLFRRLSEKADADVWICYDYRDLRFGESLDRYTDIHLIAWSLGVWVAEQIGRRYPSLPLRTATAINGTPRPIDEKYGIPPALFQATLDNLTADGIARFTRRICGQRDVLDAYRQIPERPAAAVKEELQSLYQVIQAEEAPPVPMLIDPQAGHTSHSPIPWSNIILSRHDRIFPPDNLRRYWAGRCPIHEADAPHYPFYLWKQWHEIWKQ